MPPTLEIALDYQPTETTTGRTTTEAVDLTHFTDKTAELTSQRHQGVSKGRCYCNSSTPKRR